MVGHSPSKSSDPAVPLVSGVSGLNLAVLAGLPVRWWSFLFECTNLFISEPVLRSTADQRAEAAQRLRPRMQGRRSILLGREVAAAFGFKDPPKILWTVTPDAARLEVAMLPHPSPSSRWWQREGNWERGARFLRQEAAHAAADAMDHAGPLPELVEIARGNT